MKSNEFASNWAAAAKSLQSCLTLNPIDGSPPGSPVPGILQARTLEWVAISFSNAWKWKVKVKSLSHIWLLATPWTAAYQASPSTGFSRQELLEWGAIAFSTQGAKFIWLYHMDMKMILFFFCNQLLLAFFRWSLANHEYFALQHADSSNFYITEKVGQPRYLIWNTYI